MLLPIATSHQVGQILSAGRRQSDLTQADVARRLGVSQSRISAFETDPGSITLDQLLALFGIYALQLQVEDKHQPEPDPDATTVEW